MDSVFKYFWAWYKPELPDFKQASVFGLICIMEFSIYIWRDHGDDQAVQSWTRALQKTTDDEEKFILYKLLIELFEERNMFNRFISALVPDVVDSITNINS